MKRLLFFFFTSCMIALSAFSQVEDPRHPIFEKAQPDGMPLRVRMYGGSHADFVFYTTSDSIALVLDGANGYCYARAENGHLVSTGVMAHEPSQRSAEELVVASATPKLFDALKSLQRRAVRRRMPQANYLPAVSTDGIGVYGRTLGGKVNSIGEYTLPVVLVQFKDRKFNASSTNEKFLRWLNAENYTEGGAAGSVRQYFVDQSKGMFAPTFEIAARVTLDSSYVYYGKDQGDAHDVNLINQFLTEVISKLKSSGVNMSKYYDSRTDNCVPLMAIIYAGTGQAQSGQSDDIWPCEFDLGADYAEWTGGYRINSVFFGNEWSGGGMNGLGTFCHEFGHALGLPDIYATNYGHSTPLTGYWSIMESGCYVNNSLQPMDYTAHEKSQLGWLKLFEPTETHVYTLYPMTDDREPHALLLRNPANPAEYYIAENRQPGRWCPQSFGSGLLVTHIDYDSKKWSNNNVNNDGTHPRTVVVPADNVLSSDASDLYPSNSNRVLNDRSLPATDVYTGTALGHPLYAIRSYKDGTITVSYGSASAPSYFVGDTVEVSNYKLRCIVSGTKELTVISAADGYSGDVTIPNDSVYFDKNRYKFVGVASDAFANCEGLNSVHIGNRVRRVEAGAFRNSPNLTAITVSPDNSYYESIDGALYTKLPDSVSLVPVSGTMDFSANTQNLPVSPSLRDYESYPLPASVTEQDVTVSFTDGETPCFLWNASVGIRLRTAKDCVLKISAPSGYMITSMKFIANSLNATVDSGELNSRDWTGNANTVTMTCNGACTIQSITAVMQRNADDRHLVAGTNSVADTFRVAEPTTVIDDYALEGLTYKCVELPSSVIEVGADALSLPSLSSLAVYNPVPPACSAQPFTLVPDVCTLHIPQGTINTYKEAAYWERFFPRMEEDLSTAISHVLINSTNSTDKAFDVLGRRVYKPTNGIYIQNGKKIVK